MLVIKGTKKIKGILDLNDVGLQLKDGDEYSLSEEQFYKHGVQVALKMGLVSYHKNSIPDPDAETIVEMRNIFDKVITINAIDSDVRPGQTFGISEELLNNADIQGALAKGILEIVSSGRDYELYSETEVKVGELFEEAPQTPARAQQQEISIPRGLDIEEAPAFLETNEEVGAPNIIDEPEPDPIQKADIPDPKGKTVVWNPNRDPIPHTKSQMDAIDARTGEIGDPGPLVEADVNISDEISFVDGEMDSERIDKHPILKDKPVQEDNGLDFITNL